MRGEKTGKLLMSFIERMIQSEQRNALFFGEHLKYKDTKYYRNLSEKERKEFNGYLRFKNLKKGLFVFILFSLGLVFILANTNFTGNVVAEFIEEDCPSFGDSLIFCVGCAFLLMLVVFMMRSKWAQRLEKEFGVIDEIY